MSEDVTNHGATPNDGSNDTQAFIDAANAANGGEVYVPEGEFILDSKRWTGGGALHFGDKSAYQPSGTSIVGAGPDKTTITIEGGHTGNYLGFVYHDSGNHDGAVVRDLTLNGNQWNQGSSNDMPNGFALKVMGSSQNVLVENCRMKDWALAGGGFQSRNIVIRNCSFINNGQGVLQTNDYRGHGLNVSSSASSVSDDGVLVEDCYFDNNAGCSVDNNGGNLTIRRCFSENNGAGVKFNDGVRTTVENSRFRDVQWRGMKTVLTDDHNELVELHDVELTNTGYESFASRTTGRFEGNNILIDNGNTDDFHKGEAVRVENKSVDIGTIAVLNTSNGAAFDIGNSSGSIDTLIHDNNAGGIGSTGGVSINSKTAGGSLAITAPTKSEVGVNSSSGDSGTTSYDHLLEIKAASGADLTTYSVTVTGDAVLGPNANSQESVTQLSDGNYLIEGQVADGGVDDFEFNGDIVKSDSAIDGDATAYVDGSAVDLTEDSSGSRTYGDYNTPEAGTTDWHKPVNENFEHIGQDVKDLLTRIEELEQQVQG